MAGDTFFLRLLRHYLPYMRFMTVLACQVHLKVNVMLAGIRYILMTFHRAVRPIRTGFDVRVMALVTVKLHGSVGRDLYLYRFLYGLRLRHEMLHVNGRVSDQFLPHRIVTVTEETFLSPRHKVLCPVGVAIETGEGSHRQAGL